MSFDFYHILKGIRLSTWGGTKSINIGGTNLRNINHGNIGNQIKFVGTLKYFQTSLTNVTSTIDQTEKERIKAMLEKFILSHDYFSEVWKTLPLFEKDKIIEILSCGRGLIPFEVITKIVLI